MKKKGTTAILVISILLFGACSLINPSNLVPMTVDQNPELPSIDITVRDYPAKIHYRSYGFEPGAPPAEPVVFLMHGSLMDMRAYLPLAEALSADYPVFMWDLRGNGLSQRVPAEQLGYGWMTDEIEAVRELTVGDASIILLGYSWSGSFAALYAGAHPENLEGLIFLEPPGFTGEAQNSAGSASNLFGAGYTGMTYLSEVISPADHELIDFRSLAMLESGVRDFFVDINNRPAMPVWRVGGLAVSVWEAAAVGSLGFEYDHSAGLSDFKKPVLFLGSDHSPIGYDFQKKWNLPYFDNAEIRMITNAGHRFIVEQPEQVLATLQDFIGRHW